MYSQDATVAALLAYYREVVKQPYLDETALQVAPAGGWLSIDEARLRKYGKNDTVIELLRHLPYLDSPSRSERLLVDWETVPLNYKQTARNMMDEVYPVPGHCVYLTTGVDREGFSRILDTERGTITNYSTVGYDNPPKGNEYNDPEDAEEWRRARTLPIAEFCDLWTQRLAKLVDMLIPNPTRQPTTAEFLTRAGNHNEGKALASLASEIEEWHPDPDVEVADVGGAWQKRCEALRLQRTVDAYNTYLRHGWTGTFDKKGCRTELLELQKRFRTKERKLLDEVNPDDGLFDHEPCNAQIQRAST